MKTTDRLLSIADVENEIITAIEQSPEGEQDPVWAPVYRALEELARLASSRAAEHPQS